MKYKTTLVLGILFLLSMSLVLAFVDKKVTSKEGIDSKIYQDKFAEKKFDCGNWDKTSKLDHKDKFRGGHGMVYGVIGFGIVKLISIALITFMISVIFWLTHNWLAKGKK